LGLKLASLEAVVSLAQAAEVFSILEVVVFSGHLATISLAPVHLVHHLRLAVVILAQACLETVRLGFSALAKTGCSVTIRSATLLGHQHQKLLHKDRSISLLAMELALNWVQDSLAMA
jgi:hypothetical protein